MHYLGIDTKKNACQANVMAAICPIPSYQGCPRLTSSQVLGIVILAAVRRPLTMSRWGSGNLASHSSMAAPLGTL